MNGFAVTFEIVTEESAADGDAESRGYIGEQLPLREAMRLVCETQEGIESSDSRVEFARWFTVYNSTDYLSGICETRSLHIPENVTGASRRRIARLLGVR